MSAKPLLSIIVPTYNQRPDFLRATVASVLAQTFDDFELVVSENHSTNEAPKVLHEFSDRRLRIVRPPEHLAMAPHFKFAGEQTDTRYLSFLASDDLVTPDWLSELMPVLQENPDCAFGFGEIVNVHHERIDEVRYSCRGYQLPSGVYSPRDMLRLFLPLSRSSSWLVGDVIRTDAYHAAGGVAQPGIAYTFDHALGIRLLEIGGAVYVNKLFGIHRSWGAEDGKVDARRFRAAIDDPIAIYNIVEKSERLSKYLPDLARELEKAKRKKATILALLLLDEIASGNIDRVQIAAAKADIRKLDSSPVVELLLRTANPRLAPAFRFTSGFAKRIYRAVVAPRLNRPTMRAAS